ncbi:MAG: hypothetical protein SNI70_10750 [Rikenellaceae bacterium]
MNPSIIITQEDSKGRKVRHELWFHDGFVAIHLHGWTDHEALAKQGKVCRFIFGSWYFKMETVFYFGAFQKLMTEISNDPNILEMIQDWYQSNKN